MITLSQILFSTLYSINKYYLWLQAHKFYNFSLTLITTLPNFLVWSFHCCCVLSNFIFDLLCACIIFPRFLLLFLQTLWIPLVFDSTLVDSIPSMFLHYLFYAFCNMVTFHASEFLDLTIMVNDLGMIVVFEHCLWAMFAFQLVLYIYLKTSCMILITSSQVISTKFLWPLRKGDNGWLVVAIIALLVIAWLIILRKPSLWKEPQVLWSRL